MHHIRAKFYGKVQGINFRSSAKKKADELKVTGFIMNEPDGSVYIEAEGEKENLENFLNWCRKGPKKAEVENFEYQEHPELKNFKDFKIITEYPSFK